MAGTATTGSPTCRRSAGARPSTSRLIFSELGAEALAGFHDLSATPRKFSEEYQAEYYRATLAMADRIPFLRGMSPWILKDFRSPRRQNPLYQQGWNRKGLISETGRRKLAFQVLADYYRPRAPRPPHTDERGGACRAVAPRARGV